MANIASPCNFSDPELTDGDHENLLQNVDTFTPMVQLPVNNRFDINYQPVLSTMHYYGVCSSRVTFVITLSKRPIASGRDYYVKCYLEKPGGKGGIILNIVKLRSASNGSILVGTVTDGVCEFYKTSNRVLDLNGTAISVAGGLSAWFCYVTINYSNIYTFEETKPGARRIFVWKAVTLLPDEAQSPDIATGAVPKLALDAMTVTCTFQYTQIQPVSTVFTGGSKVNIDVNFLPFITKMKQKKVVVKPAAVVEKPAVEETLLPQENPDRRPSVPDVMSLEDIATPVATAADLMQQEQNAAKLKLTDLSHLNLAEFTPPGFMLRAHAKQVNKALKEYLRTLTDSNDEKLDIVGVVGMIQGALTYSTCPIRQPPAQGEFVNVRLGEKLITIDFLKIRSIIADSVSMYDYANPVRQYLRWFSPTTIELIKTQKATPNYSVMAKHGVVKEYIPYCFDFCVMDARYNTKDQKIGYALARTFAINQSLKRNYKKGDLRNTSEL